jgi:CRP/FNR family transcriptional regulator, cyclic AMP receptor protein
MTRVDPEALRKATVFSTCTAEDLTRMVQASEVTKHGVGDSLTEQGVVGYRFYLLLEGSAVVDRDGSTIGSVGPGEFVGEVGLLGGGPSTATVRCTAPTTCLTLRREAFWAVLEERPAIALRILEVVCRRLEHAFQQSRAGNLPKA